MGGGGGHLKGICQNLPDLIFYKNETAGVSRGWSLIRDLTEPFRPHI